MSPPNFNRHGEDRIPCVCVACALKSSVAGRQISWKKREEGLEKGFLGSPFPRRSPLEYDYDVGTYLNSPTIRVEIDRLV